MAKKKRYYWLKLKDDFFNDRIIRKMRKLDNGLTYLFIYQRMLLMSLNDDGNLVFEGLEESMFEQLADELEEDVDMVRETIDFCVKYELLIIDGDVYYLTMFPELVGSECDSTDRVRKHRKLKAALHCNAEVTDGNELELAEISPVTKCNTEIEKKKKINKESNKELEEELEKKLEKELRIKKEEYERNNKTKTKNLEPISQSVGQSIPVLSQENNNVSSLSDEDIQYFIDLWNTLNLSEPIKKLTEKQIKKLSDNTNMFVVDKTNAIGTIDVLIDNIVGSSYLLGITEHNFKLNINWLLCPEKWEKVINGDYRDFINDKQEGINE